jgi:hypothetical protein
MNFESLQNYYDYLESDCTLSHDINVSKSLINLRDKSEENSLKSFCSYELFFTAYSLDDGVLRPQVSLPKGESYPNFSLFEDDLKYIMARAGNVKNPKHKAKYNHLLWESKHKHNDYAKQAIDNYLMFLKSVSLPPEDNLAHHTFGDYYRNLFTLCQTINYRKEETIQFLISLLGSNKINGFKEYSLMKFITEEGKKIDTITLHFLFDYSIKVVNDAVYPNFIGDYLELIIILCHKLNVSPKPFHNKMAEFHISESAKQEESFVIHDFYLKALAQYQKATNKTKIEEVTVLVEQAKRKINLKSVKTEFTNELLQNWWDLIRKRTDELISKGESKEIYEYIMLEEIFPKADVLGQDIRPSMFDFVSVMTFDINKNVSNNEKSGINPYFLHVSNFSIRHLWLIFSKGIKGEKINFDSFITFLKMHTWYGQDFTFLNADGESEGFNWIELLSPSLFSFFIQSEIDIKTSTNNNKEYILCIDSLTIKFEGLLREFSRKIGAQTIEIKENGTEERISFEKLLENEKFKGVIPPDDTALFKFLFTSDGMNLRNNIAHCFYHTKNYSPGIMFLLIAALLKLGNYKFDPKE